MYYGLFKFMCSLYQKVESTKKGLVVKINHNPNILILLRLYYYNQRNKTSQDDKCSYISSSIKAISREYKIRNMQICVEIDYTTICTFYYTTIYTFFKLSYGSKFWLLNQRYLVI